MLQLLLTAACCVERSIHGINLIIPSTINLRDELLLLPVLLLLLLLCLLCELGLSGCSSTA